MSSTTLRRTVLLLSILCLGLLYTSVQTVYGQAEEDIPRVTKAFALIDARIVQAPGRVIEEGTVIVRDGFITDVGEDLEIPYDVEPIRADTLTVYPGFIDGLSHAGMPEPEKDRRERRREVDRPGDPPDELAGIQPQRQARELLDPSNDRIEELRRQGFTTAHVVPRGDMLPGTGAVIVLGEGDRSQMVLEPETAMFARFGTAPGMYPATDMAVRAKFRQLYREAERRMRRRSVAEERPEDQLRPVYDPVYDAFFPVVSGDRPVFFHAERAVEIHRALQLQEETGFPLVLTGLSQGFETIGTLQSADLPLFLTLDLPKPPEADRDSTARDTSAVEPQSPYQPGFRTRSYREVDDERAVLRARQELEREKYFSTASRLQEGNLSFGVTTLGVEAGDILNHLRLMVEYGLSEEAALAALTTYPAEVFDLTDKLGTVEPGKLGNLVVTNGSLFEEDSEIRLVFVEGRKFAFEESTDEEQRPEDEKRSGQNRFEAAPGEISDRESVEDAAGDLFIADATVLTVTQGTLEDTDILVRDGTIVEMGTDLSAPSGVKRIDASGQYVMPGIVDAHSHIAIDDINEATNPVTSEVRVGDVLDPYDINLYRALAGGVTTSHVMHGSANVIGGQNETIKHRYGQTDPDALRMQGAPRTIKFALGENPTRVHGQRNQVPPRSRMGVEFVLRKAFNEARRYEKRWEEYRRRQEEDENAVPPAYNERLEIIARILDGEIQVHCHSYRADEILMVMEVLEEFGIDNVTFQHVNEGFKIAPELAEFGAGASVFSDWWAYKFEVYYSTAYNASILTRNDVLTSINSDSPELNRHLYHEAAKSQRYGDLGETEALSLITINPARQLGIADRVGSIEVGKDGDLAIFDEHPLSIYAICQTTVVDGVVRFDADSDPDDMRLQVEPETPIRETTVWQEEDRHLCLRGTDLYEFAERALRP